VKEYFPLKVKDFQCLCIPFMLLAGKELIAKGMGGIN
jgi:hypothetical protein